MLPLSVRILYDEEFGLPKEHVTTQQLPRYLAYVMFYYDGTTIQKNAGDSNP